MFDGFWLRYNLVFWRAEPALHCFLLQAQFYRVSLRSTQPTSPAALRAAGIGFLCQTFFFKRKFGNLLCAAPGRVFLFLYFYGGQSPPYDSFSCGRSPHPHIFLLSVFLAGEARPSTPFFFPVFLAGETRQPFSFSFRLSSLPAGEARRHPSYFTFLIFFFFSLIRGVYSLAALLSSSRHGRVIRAVLTKRCGRI